MAGNYAPDALKMVGMDTYNTDSTGSRIAWARKQHRMSGHDLARAVGVRNVYISQIENDHRIPSRQVLQQIAEALGVTVGFLLMETDTPQPAGAESEPGPVYFSEEADAAARLVDDAPPEERARMLAVLRAMSSTATANNSVQENGGRVIYLPYQPGMANPVRDRLIQSALLPQQGEVARG